MLRAVPDLLYKIENLSYRYTDTDSENVIHEISLDIRRGECLVLLGPSGCGKSTLLSILAGLTPPSEGEVRFEGEAVREGDSRIGLVFQDASLLPWRTVGGNIEIGLEIRGVRKRERKTRVAHLLRWIGLEAYEKKYPRELSGGMLQRVGLARALANDPDIVLMDEPFSALDYQTRRRLQTDLLRIKAEGDKTIVFVTHDISEAIRIADRILLFSHKPVSIVSEFVIDRDGDDSSVLERNSALAVKIYEAFNRVENDAPQLS